MDLEFINTYLDFVRPKTRKFENTKCISTNMCNGENEKYDTYIVLYQFFSVYFENRKKQFLKFDLDVYEFLNRIMKDGFDYLRLGKGRLYNFGKDRKPVKNFKPKDVELPKTIEILKDKIFKVWKNEYENFKDLKKKLQGQKNNVFFLPTIELDNYRKSFFQ